MEARVPKLYGHMAVEVPGARTLLNELNAGSVPWAVVTSGTKPLATGWLHATGLPTPEHLITAEMVSEGKPRPAGYLIGRDRLGLAGAADEVVVFEDAPAGIIAGKAAGCRVVGLVTSHSAEQVLAAAPDWVVRDLASVRVMHVKEGGDGFRRVTLELRDCLVTPHDSHVA